MLAATKVAFAVAVADSTDTSSATPFTLPVCTSAFPELVVQLPLAFDSNDPKPSEFEWIPVRCRFDFRDY
jgi:hypothetical protein